MTLPLQWQLQGPPLPDVESFWRGLQSRWLEFRVPWIRSSWLRVQSFLSKGVGFRFRVPLITPTV